MRQAAAAWREAGTRVSALAGVDTAVRGTAANVAHVHQTLTRSVRLDGGADVQQVQPLVPASPGAQHGSGPVSSLLGPPGAGADPAGHGGLPGGGHLDPA